MTRQDAALAVGLAALSVPLALLTPGTRPDALGWTLLVCCQIPLLWRRTHTTAALVVTVAFLGPYHALGYPHAAPVLGSMTLLFTAAATSPAWRAAAIGTVVIGGTVAADWVSDAGGAVDTLRTSGWIAAVLVAGATARVHRQLVAATTQRAERAERTREEVAARRVVEERLRIARDLHDLLAHSITLIGVRTAVAAHVMTVAPEEFDRAAVSKALDGIADTCRAARVEVRTTLEVLRYGERAADEGPLPGLAALSDLARPAGARLNVLTAHGGSSGGADPHIPPAVEAAAYRIVQEALTNTTRHAGAGARAEVTVRVGPGSLLVEVTDDGGAAVGSGPRPGPGLNPHLGPNDGPHDGPHDGPAHGPDLGPGFGLIGMRERVRSVGGTLTAGPLPGGGFRVTADLPLTPRADACTDGAAAPEDSA
ncbi:histidine kinase [Streptomyces sp. NPDC008139]|uniref:sensor histidine kinase n=1 Tax=Streptomyces sp. NPDC008139 TaxID=3364814 RepID=UPI0036E4EE1B